MRKSLETLVRLLMMEKGLGCVARRGQIEKPGFLPGEKKENFFKYCVMQTSTF
jgi:hypothetical protein